MVRMSAVGIFAGFLVAQAGGTAAAGVSRITGAVRAESIATASIFGAEARDDAEAELNPNLDADTIGTGLSWSDRSDASAGLNGAWGTVDAAVSADLGANAVSVSNWAEGSAGIVDADTQQAGVQHRTEAELFLYFDKPTWVDLVFRIEYAGSPDGMDRGYGASLSVSGLDGQGPVGIEAIEDGQAFVQELSLRALVSDDVRPLVLQMDTWADLSPDGLDSAAIGRLSVFASITVVPAPATPALLAIGLVTISRRRR